MALTGWIVIMKEVFKQIWLRIKGLNGLLLILYTTFVIFSMALANGYSNNFLLIVLLLTGLVATIFCPTVIRAVARLHITTKENIAKQTQLSAICKRLLFFMIPCGVFLIYYFGFYPGGFTSDSFSQYEQSVTDCYRDWHPVLQTLFSYKLPLALTGGWLGSIVLFQILCFSAILSYVFSVLSEYTNWKFTILSMCFILLNPQVGCLVLYSWKDAAFAMGTILVLTYALRIFVTKGAWLQKPLHIAVFILATVFTTIFRHNAILFTAPLILAACLYVTKKRGIVLILGIVVLFAAIKLPLYAALDVSNPDKRQIETLGFPMTVIGAVTAKYPEALDSETKEFVYAVAPKEVWEDRYKPGTYNYIKWDERTNNDVIEEYGAVKVLSMMVRTCLAAKNISLNAIIHLTDTIYALSNTTPFVSLPSVDDNTYGFVAGGNPVIQELLTNYYYFVFNNFNLLFNLGAMHLVILVAILSKGKLTKAKNWKKLLFVIPLFTYNYGTSLLLTGAEDAVRFFSYTFFIVPILLVFIFKKDTEGNIDTQCLNIV